MSRRGIVSLVLIYACFQLVTAASVANELTALEKDLEGEHLNTAAKKSLNDFTTDELLDELKKEINTEGTAHNKRFKTRFNDIIKKTTKDDDLSANQLLNDLKREIDTIRAHQSKDAKKETNEVNREDKKWIWKKSLDVMADELMKRTEGAKETCVDVRTDCHDLKRFCSTHKAKLLSICAKTCQYCVSCTDKLRNCYRLYELNQCDQQRQRMTDLCPQTCGFCKAPAPPKCSKSQFGCCWNKETLKTSKDGSNCPVCVDQYKYVCKMFRTDCSSFKTAGDFMRHYCPQTCQLCNTECRDVPKHAFYCPFWKKDLKWCTLKPSIMRHFCPKTCELC